LIPNPHFYSHNDAYRSYRARKMAREVVEAAEPQTNNFVDEQSYHRDYELEKEQTLNFVYHRSYG